MVKAKNLAENKVQEWTNRRNAKSSRSANFVREPGFTLNSPYLLQGETSELRRKMGFINLFVLDAIWCWDGGSVLHKYKEIPCLVSHYSATGDAMFSCDAHYSAICL